MDAETLQARGRNRFVLGTKMLRRGCEWWLRELVSLLPRRWQQRLARFERMPLYVWRRSTLMLAAASEQPVSTAPIAVGLDPGSVQIICLELPAVIEPTLRQSLSLQLGRHTPFPLERVLFDFIIEKRVPQRQALQVLLAIVPKAIIAEVFTAARDSRLIIGRIGIVQEPAENCLQFNFLEQGTQHTPEWRLFWRRPWFASVMVLLLMGVGFSLWNAHRNVQELQIQVDLLNPAAQEAERLQRELKVLDTRARFLGEKREHTNSLAWLTEVTHLLPDDVWLTEVQRNGAEIRIAGYAADASGLIGIIDASSKFEHSKFSAPVRREGEREQFDLLFVVTTEVSGTLPAQTDTEKR